jgi:predicted nucleic acid-binding Zn ribbon protein|tara:strand:+ start:568 stop:744 length:177 start_codon:yes stop_codon:yes gene_type:complete
MTNEVESLITTLTDALTDATKHDTGNNAAGARLRKALQEVVVSCKGLRKTVQDERNTR